MPDSPRPTQTLRVAHAASRRALASQLLLLGGRALGLGSVAALALVAADKLAGGVAPWPLLVGLPLALSAVAAVAWAVLRRWSPLQAAIELDRALGLKDRLSSALEFEAHGRSDPFARIALRDAETAAREVKLNQVIPLRPDWTWIAWPLAGAAAIAAALWAPHMVWSEPPARERRPIATAAETAAEVAAATEVAQTVVESTVEDLASPEELETLRELHEQLVNGQSDPDEARAKAAGEIEQLAGKLESQAREQQMQQDLLRERLAQLSREDAGPGEGSPLAAALERGDLAAARDAVRALMNGADELTPEQRAQAARELERLANDPAETPEPSAGAPPDASEGGGDAQSPPEGGGAESQQPDGPTDESLRQELADQGLSPEQIERLSQSDDPAEIAESLKQSGVDPAAAERLSERVAQESQRRESRERAERQVEELRDAMNQAADELREPPSEGSDPARQERPQDRRSDERQPGEPDPQGSQEQDRQDGRERRSGEQPPGDTPGQPQPQPPGQQQNQQGEQPGDQPQQAPGKSEQPKGEQQGERQGDQSGEGQGEQPAPQPQPAPGAPAQSPQPQPAPQGDQQGGQRQQGSEPGAQQGNQPGEPRQGQEPGQGRDSAQQGEAAPGERPQGGEQGARPATGENQGQAQGREGVESQDGQGTGAWRGSGLRTLERQLERMARGASDAQRQGEQARRLRQMAEEMLEKSTPEEREELRRWAEKLQQEQAARRAASGEGWSGGAEDVDARRTPEGQRQTDERVVAEWFGDTPAEQDGGVSREPVGDQIRQAVRSAERAVEGQEVMPRHRELIRRVFRRYSQRSETPAPPEGER